jgi:hypothetical protein
MSFWKFRKVKSEPSVTIKDRWRDDAWEMLCNPRRKAAEKHARQGKHSKMGKCRKEGFSGEKLKIGPMYGKR